MDKVIPESNSGCWIWIGATNGRGYGNFKRHAKAHRVSWELYYGKIPNGLCVLHKCDVKLCVNPNHLWLGTYKDNNYDMHLKHRNAQHKNYRFCNHKHDTLIYGFKEFSNGTRRCLLCYQRENVVKIQRARLRRANHAHI
jgi:hypothetical protein